VAAKVSPASGVGLCAVYAREDGSVLDLPEFEAAADSGIVGPADPRDFIPLPPGSTLLTLPGRLAIGYKTGKQIVCNRNSQQITAVAAALPLGYTRVLLPAYVERENAPPLPLYGYTAVAWSYSGFRAAAVRTDELESWSAESHCADRVREGIALRSLEFSGNSLVAQLARCATEYNCFTAQNVFLRQGEAALPVSPACNARCLGCISEQEPESQIRSAQERVRARPTLDEITEVAVTHLSKVTNAIVSFGQGCEGEPLLAAQLIEQAIRRIRTQTSSGTIHCNTNASQPKALRRLIEAGLQSIRISLNSARPEVYAAYYRPRRYGLEDVVESLSVAADAGISISLNLLTHPGVTDLPAEMRAFERLLRDYPIDMVQTRTLNVDPAVYFAAAGRPREQPFGMRWWLEWLKREFPNVKVGNFTRGFG
jgi:pyruvate-formate lyase-activating enzyme